MKTRFSIITVCFNNQEGLVKTRRSVVTQTSSDYEHIIIDGGSSDGTPLLFEKCEFKTAKIVSEPDDGIYDAMNKGINIASGQFVVFLNSGDCFADVNVLSDVAHCLDANDGLKAIYGNKLYADAGSGKINRVWRPGVFKRWKYYFGWMTPHQATYIERKLYKENRFDTTMKIAADYDLMLRLLLFDKALDLTNIKYFDRHFIVMEAGGISNANAFSVVKSNLECLKAWRKHQVLVPFWIFFFKPIMKISQLWKSE